MKKLALILLFAVSAFGQSIQERVKKFENAKAYSVQYDKRVKETVVRYATSIKIPLFVYATIADSGRVEYLFLHATTTQAPYFPMTMRVQLEAELIELDSVEHNGDIYNGVAFPVTPSQFERIASSPAPELQFSYFEGKLDPKTLAGFKNLISLSKLQTATPPKK